MAFNAGESVLYTGGNISLYAQSGTVLETTTFLGETCLRIPREGLSFHRDEMVAVKFPYAPPAYRISLVFAHDLKLGNAVKQPAKGPETSHVCPCCEPPVHIPPVTLTVTVSGPVNSGRSTLMAAIVNLLEDAGVTSIVTEDELGRVTHLHEHQSWKKMLFNKKIIIRSEQTARAPLRG